MVMLLSWYCGFLFLIERTSIFKWSTIPDTFGVVLLSLTLILVLAPYFSNTDFGLFKIPEFSLRAKARLKVIGPIVFGLCLVCFLPIIPNSILISENKSTSLPVNPTPLPSRTSPPMNPTPLPTPNSSPNPNNPIDVSPASTNATGWIYVGTLIDKQWRFEPGGAGTRPTLELPDPSIPEKGTFRVVARVHLREGLPTGPDWQMKGSLGFIKEGSSVYIDEFKYIEEKHWVWGHVSNRVYK